MAQGNQPRGGEGAGGRLDEQLLVPSSTSLLEPGTPPALGSLLHGQDPSPADEV